MKRRLSAMMFLQMFSAGSVIPVLSLYFGGTLNFTGTQTGIILAVSALAGFLAPSVMAALADRKMAAERLYALSHIGAGCFLLALSQTKSFWPCLLLFAGYILLYEPTVALSNAITFHHLPNQRERFGEIRLWGTMGWIATAWIFGSLYMGILRHNQPEYRHHALIFGGVIGIVLGLWSLTLPTKEGSSEAPKTRSRLKGVISPGLIMLFGGAFLFAAADKYYYFGMAPFLSRMGVAEGRIMPLMSIGQVTEVMAMAVLAKVLAKWGSRRTLITGMAVSSLRFAALGFAPNLGWAAAAIPLHGISFSFFMAAYWIVLDQDTTEQNRASVHQISAIITSGAGSLAGNLIAGKITDLAGTTPEFYKLFWGIPAAATLCACILIGKGLNRNPQTGIQNPVK